MHHRSRFSLRDRRRWLASGFFIFIFFPTKSRSIHVIIILLRPVIVSAMRYCNIYILYYYYAYIIVLRQNSVGIYRYYSTHCTVYKQNVLFARACVSVHIYVYIRQKRFLRNNAYNI